ncbi:MAG: hypothetical protein ABI221_02170 [Candidatus Saccharimonadales bacterium]
MSSIFIALLLALGAGTWIYSKLIRSTGGNTRSAATGSIISAVLIFLAAWYLVGLIPA